MEITSFYSKNVEISFEQIIKFLFLKEYYTRRYTILLLLLNVAYIATKIRIIFTYQKLDKVGKNKVVLSVVLNCCFCLLNYKKLFNERYHFA